LDAKAFGLIAALLVLTGACLCGFVGEPGRTTMSATPESRCRSLFGAVWSAGGIGHFTNELFEDVFEGNQAACLTVLVDQAGEV
jgi:hypothetical protein